LLGGRLCALLALLSGCASAPPGLPMLPPGWSDRVVAGEGFDHRVLRRKVATGHCLRVFIEGDGSPWATRTRVAADPTPRNPVLLRIAQATPGRVLYLGRPCYFGLAASPACGAENWTFGRYSDAVVRSLAAVVSRQVQSPVDRVALVGHSGGGTLAVLTLAAPLDTAAWARRHDFTPLFLSLDPATQPPLPDSIRQLHLLGEDDDNVPPGLNRAFAAHNPGARFRVLGGMAHDLAGRAEGDWAALIDRELTRAGCPAD